MGESILVTGGAGFIGSHLVSSLLAEGYEVKIIDALLPQVHGDVVANPPTIPDDVCFVRANLCDQDQLEPLLEGVDIVVHLAADVGVGQSMYEIVRYVRNNTLGTASLLQTLLPYRKQIRKLVVASSMSIYGEGAYVCQECGRFNPRFRPLRQLQNHNWEMYCPSCGKMAQPAPTAEEKPLYPNSIYAITKRDHEEMCLTFGQAYDIPTVALRFFNVYGPGQKLSNPYTGVAAIFCSRLINRTPPIIFEDGLQTRDFVHVNDVVSAILSAIHSRDSDSVVYNVGTGRPFKILEVAYMLARELGISIEPQISNQFRKVDIRHCYADISLITRMLGYSPKIRFEDSVKELVSWALNAQAIDQVNRAVSELTEKGLIQ